MHNKLLVESVMAQVIDQPFYVLDTETTGLDADAEACEISIIDQNGETVFDSLIKTTKPIPEGASAIHHIYNSDVVFAPTWGQIEPQLRSLLKGKTIFIYNAEYDTRIMQTCNRLYGITEPFGAVGRCVMKAFSLWNGVWDSYRGSYKWVKLSEAASMLGVDASQVTLHRAYGDCQLTLAIMRELALNGNRREQNAANTHASQSPSFVS